MTTTQIATRDLQPGTEVRIGKNERAIIHSTNGRGVAIRRIRNGQPVRSVAFYESTPDRLWDVIGA